MVLAERELRSGILARFSRPIGRKLDREFSPRDSVVADND